MKTKAFRAISTFIFLIFLFVISCGAANAQETSRIIGRDVRTGFQVASPWAEKLSLPTDVAMAYGDNPASIKSWGAHGYVTWSMFSASWLGKDEEVLKKHPEIVQMLAGGVPFEMIKGRAWVAPVGPWHEHIKAIIHDVVGAGARAILPEEPEFFAITGYSDAFKKEWQLYYGEPWQAPNSSLSAQWKANQLKAYLFTEFYRDIFRYTKQLDNGVQCIIPMHSNLNYADWGIVSPHHAYTGISESDGFVGQVWTGTAKGTYNIGGTPTRSVFDYSFLEYSFFQNLTRDTQKTMWFLTDAVEDEPGASWDTLRGWYEDTLTAELMQPYVNHYEVVPWPERVFITSDLYGGEKKSPAPADYATELMTVWAAQREMPAGDAEVESGSDAVGFLTADTLMWQRGSGHDRFKGHVAPMLSLLRHGVYVNVLPAERFVEGNFPPKNIKLIVASFDAWKPLTQGIVNGIAAWVKGGGTLVFIGGTDEYDAIDGNWWKASGSDTPADALLTGLLPDVGKKKFVYQANEKRAMKILGDMPTERRILKATSDAPAGVAGFATTSISLPITSYDVASATVWMKTGDRPVVWEIKCGGGRLIYTGFSGEAVAQLPEGEKLFFEIIRGAGAETADMEFNESDKLVVRRGPFVIAHSEKGELALQGKYADLLQPQSPVKQDVSVAAGENAFLLDIEKASSACAAGSKACILLAGGNVESAGIMNNGFYDFNIKGPDGTNGGVWIYVPGNASGPKSVVIPDAQNGGQSKIDFQWDAATRTAHFIAPLSAKGTKISMELVD